MYCFLRVKHTNSQVLLNIFRGKCLCVCVCVCVIQVFFFRVLFGSLFDRMLPGPPPSDEDETEFSDVDPDTAEIDGNGKANNNIHRHGEDPQNNHEIVKNENGKRRRVSETETSSGTMPPSSALKNEP